MARDERSLVASSRRRSGPQAAEAHQPPEAPTFITATRSRFAGVHRRSNGRRPATEKPSMSEAPEMPEIEESDIHDKRLNRAVATTVVILSVTMALVNIKDGNIVQNMQQAQATQVDSWNEYQATRLKLHMEEIAAANGGPAVARAEAAIAKYAKESA